MMQNQIDLESIGSDMVGFDHPYCAKHNRKHKIDAVRRKIKGNVLEVVRYHHCEQCRIEGKDDPRPLINSRDFTSTVAEKLSD